LTSQEKKALEDREKKVLYFYADPDIEDDMKSPEKIYDYLYNLMPKCPKCGRLGMYQKPKKDNGNGKDKSKNKSDKNKDSGDSKDNQSGQCGSDGNDNNDGGCSGDSDGDNKSGGSCCGGCGECGKGMDIFGLGGTLDDHIDSDEDEEKLARRISDAMEAAKKMAGHVPAALEDELGKLLAPKVTWQDFIRTQLLKSRAGNGRNDWTKFKTRPMFCGILNPRRRNYFAKFGCLLDTSGSMSKDDMAFGLSQLCALDERSEGTIVCADAEIYWDKALKIKKANIEEISKIKPVGRGGTMFSSFFDDYEKNIGKCDFLVVVSDGFLLDTDIASMKHPGVNVIWLITSGSVFNPPFGKAYDLCSL